MKILSAAFAVIMACGLSLSGHVALADDVRDYDHGPEAQDFVHGEPEYPSEAWVLAAGGRIYDNWWNALDRDPPTNTNPAYPTDVNAKRTGAGTWRCKECHGWDYRGAAGVYSKGSHYTGIKGLEGVIGLPVSRIMATLRDENHPYTKEMINDIELERVASFVSRGQVEMHEFIDPETRKIKAGNANRGRAVFQTTCAACHGFDGRLLDWGEGDEHLYIGSEAPALPDEVFHKIYSAHPGVQMINLRAFPVEVAIDVLAYAATLPSTPPDED